MALFGNGKVDRLEKELSDLKALVPVEVFQGMTVDSPYLAESGSRSMLPWRRNSGPGIVESAQPTTAPARQGFLADIPRGGANEWNQGYTQIGGVADRRSLMDQMQQLYAACIPAAACVDAVARFSTAAGMSIEPDDESNERKDTVVLSPQAQKCQALFDYVNPGANFRQLMRQIFTDLQIYGDSFIEVVWALGEPIALYSLPCPDMLIDANEHGEVNFYVQRTETNRRAEFEPHQVIHIKFDSPRGGLYGLGPTEKAVHGITTWIFTQALLKETMKMGNPPNVGIGWDINIPNNEIKKLAEIYRSQHVGPKNLGNPANLKGDTAVHEFKPNAIAEYLATIDTSRDQICGGFGVPPAIVSIIESGNLGGGTGTALDLSTPVPTLSGWTTMGELQVGDRIFDEAGKPCTVLATYETPDAESWRLTFSDGTLVDCCSDHLWTTWTIKSRKAWGRNESRTDGMPLDWPSWRSDKRVDGTGPTTLATREIVETLNIGERSNHSIPLAGALKLPDADLPIDPYVLGVWLGDGTTGAAAITCGLKDEAEMASLIHAAGYETKEWTSARAKGSVAVHNILGLKVTLREHGLLTNKHIPDAYLRGSYDQRLALLQGLMDSDGGAGNHQVVFCNTNERLVDGIVELARSLGQKPVKAKRSATFNGVDYGVAYQVKWSATVQPFRLERKAEQFSPSTHAMTCWQRTIVNAERIPNRDMRCIKVDSPHSLFLAGEGMIPTHNSQFKNFKVNTCGPIQELVLEAFTFAILEQGFGVTDHRCNFGEVDWRDDEVIEKIRTMRVERAGWNINRYRDDIGEPPVEGGDDPVIIQTRDVILVKDLADMSKNAAAKGSPTGASEGGSAGPPGPPDAPSDTGAPALPAPADGKPPAHANESDDEETFVEAFRADYQRRVKALRELPKVDA
jgi:hypothetical protein